VTSPGLHMANLRQRTVTKQVKSPAKRSSSRNTGTVTEKYEEVKIESDDSEDILLDEEEEGGQISKNELDILDGYGSDNNHNQIKSSSSSDDISIDSELSENVSGVSGDESEDDKEIRRIIEKTEAETRNMPLTARQRAKLEGGIQDPLLQGTSHHPETDVISNEQALKMSEKSRRRKLQRAQKIEETKRATIDRLLQKQKKAPVLPTAAEEAAIKEAEKVALEDESSLKSGMTRYIDRHTETILQFPDESTFNIFLSNFIPKPHQNHDRTCQICKTSESKYTHPSNGQHFCSLSCYKLIQ
jgi:hypothetical protein